MSKGESHITVFDYVIYQDILYFGSEAEKNNRQYLMMNMKKEDDLRIEEYVDFYEQFMLSMASVFNYDMDIKFCRFAADQTF